MIVPDLCVVSLGGIDLGLKAYWQPGAVEPMFGDPLPILFGDEGVPMMFQCVLGTLSSSYVQVTLRRWSGLLEWLSSDPFFKDEPGAEVDSSLLPVPIDAVRSQGDRRRRGGERDVRGGGRGGEPVFQLVD